MQDQFSILDNLSLNVGVRYDYYQTFGSNVSPRAGLIDHPFEKTTLNLLYARHFGRLTHTSFAAQTAELLRKQIPGSTPKRFKPMSLSSNSM